MKPLDHDSRRLLEDALAADAPPPSAEARIWDALSMRLDAPLPPTAAAAKAAFESNGAGFGGTGAGGGANGGAASGGAGAGLGSGAAVGASAGVGVGSAVAIGAKIVVGALVGTASAGTLWWYANSSPLESAKKAERAAAVAVAPSTAATAKPAGLAVAEGTVAQAAQQGSAPASVQANTSSTPSLAEETQLLADAQRALSAGAPDRALTLIEAHRARFPQGSLSPEREAARVVALCALGRLKEAGRARAQFFRAWPSSPLASRVSAACPAPGARRAK